MDEEKVGEKRGKRIADIEVYNSPWTSHCPVFYSLIGWRSSYVLFSQN